MNSISTGFIVLSIVIGKNPERLFRFPFTAFASGSVVIILFLVMWRIGKHHPEGLVIDTPKNVFYTPAGGRSYLPHYTKGAMGSDIFRS